MKQTPSPANARLRSVWAIVPVKALHESKTRLAHLLSPTQRAELVQALLQHTLAVLKQVDLLDNILVVSSDPVVLAAARQHGAVALKEEGVSGINRAVTRAVNETIQMQASAALVIPADLPFLQAADVELMIARGADPEAMTICADLKNDGTNALFIPLPSLFCFHYGANSFEQHLQEAIRLGLSARVVHAPGLAFDLDNEGDWSNYQQEATGRFPHLYTSQAGIFI